MRSTTELWTFHYFFFNHWNIIPFCGYTFFPLQWHQQHCQYIIACLLIWFNNFVWISFLKNIYSISAQTFFHCLHFLFSSSSDTGCLTPATIIAANGNFTSCKDKMDFWQLWEIMKSKNNLSWNHKKKKTSVAWELLIWFLLYTKPIFITRKLAKKLKLIGLCS